MPEADKPWKYRIDDFRVTIANNLCVCACAAELARVKPAITERMCLTVKSVVERVSLLTQVFCEVVRCELVSQLEGEEPQESGPSNTVERGKSLSEKRVPWHIREEAFKSNIQHMLDYSVSALEAVRRKAEGADELARKVPELEKLTSQLTLEFCGMVARDYVNKVEEQKAAKDRKAWRRASAYSPRPKGDGGGGWVYSRNGE